MQIDGSLSGNQKWFHIQIADISLAAGSQHQQLQHKQCINITAKMEYRKQNFPLHKFSFARSLASSL